MWFFRILSSTKYMITSLRLSEDYKFITNKYGIIDKTNQIAKKIVQTMQDSRLKMIKGMS